MLIARLLHIDKINDHKAGHIAQPELARDFVRRLEIGFQCSFLNIPLRVARPEFTSTATSASVWLITR